MKSMPRVPERSRPVRRGAGAAGCVAVYLLVTPALVGAAPDRKCAQILIVMDRSLSMKDKLTSGEVKWDVASAAIPAFVKDFEGELRFGFSFLPGAKAGGGQALGATEDSVCAPGVIVYAPDYVNGDKITAAVATLQPFGATPTDTTLAALKDYAPLADPRHENFVLLVTDGTPFCDDVAPIPETVREIKALRDLGIRTFVLGFGFGTGGGNVPALIEMAEAGGVPRKVPGQPEYYAADDPAALAAALDEIAGVVGGATVAGCLSDGDAGGGGGGGMGSDGAAGAGGGAGGMGGQGGDGDASDARGPGQDPRRGDGCGCMVGAVRAPVVGTLILAAWLALASRRRRRW